MVASRCLHGDQPGQGMVTSSPMEPYLQHEGLHQANQAAPCGRGPDPTTPKWALLLGVPTGGRTEAIASLGSPSHPGRRDGKGHWLQQNALLLQESTCPVEISTLKICSVSCCQTWDPGSKTQVQRTRRQGLLLAADTHVHGGLIDPNRHWCPCELPMGEKQLCSGCPRHIRHGAAPGPPRGVSEAPSAAAQASVTHGVRTGSSAGLGSPGRQQQSEIYSTKQPENKPEECLLFFLCGREIKHDCLSPGNAGISTHGSSAEIASAAGHSQP